MQPTLYTQPAPADHTSICLPATLPSLEWALLSCSTHCTLWADRYPASATVAPPTIRDSVELADLNPTPRSPSPRALESATRTQRLGGAVLPCGPAANSQSLAGLGSGSGADWEKTASSEQHPRGLRLTRLRFWAEALRRRAHRSSRLQIDCGPETAAKMKFSHSIQFNAVPDWSANYIAYSNLKKL